MLGSQDHKILGPEDAIEKDSLLCSPMRSQHCWSEGGGETSGILLVSFKGDEPSDGHSEVKY